MWFINGDGSISHAIPAYRIAFIPLLSAFVTYFLSTFFVFLYRTLVLHDQALLERSLFLISCHMVCVLVFTCNAMIHGIAANYPCFLDVWLTMFFYNTWAFAYLLYMIRYYVIARTHKSISEQIRINPVTPDNMVEYLSYMRQTAHQMFWDVTPRRGGSSNERQSKANRASTLSSIASHSVATSSDAYTNPRIPPQPGDSSSQRTLETTRSSSRRALWAKRVLSNRFYAVAMGLYSLFLVGVLALMTSLYSHLSLKHVHYNCFGGVVFVPLLAFSGIFNLIICPMYTFLIWNYEDAYGIQKTMTFSFVTGIFAWIATLVWRLNPRWANHQISPVVVYMIQFILAHTGFVTIPVIHSIRFRKMQQQGRNDTEIMHASSFLGGASESRFADSHASKQSFLIALKNSHEHHKLEKFAEQCLCAELISFLDVYLAFKLCVYCSIVSGETNQDNCNHHCAGVDNSRSVVVPSIVITEADSTAAIPGQLEANYQAPLQQAEPLNSLSRQTSQQSKRMSRLRKHFSHALLSIRRSSSNSSQTTSITTDVTADEESITYKRAAEDLTSLDTGIVETIEHAFPQYGIAYSTPVPEELREKLVAIVKTFILPGAPWEINVSSRIIEASQEFANGGTMPCGALDDAKNEVIDLLYSNVYIRYQQLRH
ncbi:hypothetical protein BX667DRAFT_9253 [Coemansia mojavensis]|nr:hypothetical protein BX667DRAFT_9253 [Coemansia mojavensis]